ncbi:MAG: hypothetical protein OEZ11_03415, partial [Gammaproteobacteria bacterium]|nr:hypothetical protein [Gammaproteobacteria bacterium]
NGCSWPISEVFNFPKQDVQAAALGKSCHSGRAAIPEPNKPLGISQPWFLEAFIPRHVGKFQLFIHPSIVYYPGPTTM